MRYSVSRTDYSSYQAGIQPALAKYEASEKAAAAGSPYKKEIIKNAAEKTAYITAGLRDSSFYFDGVINPYYQHIFQQLVNANPALKRPDIFLLISRFTEANAYSVGNGFLVFNNALIRKFSSEAQVAFVLGHEFAHFLLDHSGRSMQDYLSVTNAATYKTELKEARRADYNSSEAVEAVRLKAVYQTRNHSRGHEREADSLGLVFLMNSKYDATEAVPALMALDKSDYELYDNIIRLDTIFNHEQYPFRSAWLGSADNPFFNNANNARQTARADSLKTHPDCPERAAAIQEWLRRSTYNSANGSRFVQGEPAFGKQVSIAEYELIENFLQQGDAGNALYHALLLTARNGEQPELAGYVAASLLACHAALKDHRLEQAIRPPSPFQQGDYKKLNIFINNLRLSEMAEVAYYYTAKRIPAYHTSEAFAYYYLQCCIAARKQEAYTTGRKTFAANFPQSKYLGQLP